MRLFNKTLLFSVFILNIAAMGFEEYISDGDTKPISKEEDKNQTEDTFEVPVELRVRVGGALFQQDYKVAICQNNTLGEILELTAKKYYLETNLYFKVSFEKIKNFCEKVKIYVYFFGEPYHRPSENTKIGSLKDYKNLRFLVCDCRCMDEIQGSL